MIFTDYADSNFVGKTITALLRPMPAYSVIGLCQETVPVHHS